MYKKIMFLIITLSIIINVGNSTVVMAKENIVTEIVDFPVTINYEESTVKESCNLVSRSASLSSAWKTSSLSMVYVPEKVFSPSLS